MDKETQEKVDRLIEGGLLYGERVIRRSKYEELDAKVHKLELIAGNLAYAIEEGTIYDETEAVEAWDLYQEDSSDG